ncbi:FACT complex subunit SPT16 isoform X2 [Brachionus plicatilis]|uniref:FACT complex subunit n=1 Tax=Brachionus plicatilis TaxID=10195 RepID=A0A3M7RGL8_BRAPC|nr:FACT complex subunit SPT16 isoform X2 [Brachionus plicatilis]
MPDLDKETFNKRIKRFYTYWQNTKKDNEIMDAVCVVTGTDSDSSYYKATAIQQWLFGVEITDTAILFLDKLVVFVASPKKIQFLKQIESGKENDHLPRFKFIIREKNESDKSFLTEAIELIKKSKEGKKIGVFPKEKFDGDFFKDWNKSLDQAGFDKTDASGLVSSILAIKDELELNSVKKASEITNKVFSKYLKEQIINIIDGEKKVKHAKLSEGVEQAINDSRYVSTSDKQLVEICYPAIIQSGGNYSLKFSASSDKNNLHFGTIICALGFRYKNYCSNIVRTLMVDPAEQMQQNYKYLLSLEEALIDSLRDGVKLNDLYDKIKQKCHTDRSDLVDKLTPNFGFLIGIEFREANFLISNKNSNSAKAGMTFQVSIGLADLVNAEAKDEHGKKYALFIGDTVQVNKDEAATVFTQSKKKMENVGIFIKDEEADDQSEEEKSKGEKKESVDLLSRATRGALLQSKTRADTNQEHARREHQRELGKRLNEEARERLLAQKGPATKEKVRKAINAYRNAAQLPYKQTEIQELKIYVDKGHETIILPVFGAPSPFHISTLKNLSSSVEGDFTYLRLNFFHPGVTINKPSTAPSEGTYPNQDCVYIKEITYRATNIKEAGEISAPSTNLGLAFKYIKDMQKEFKEKEHEEKEKEGMVKQDSLVLSHNKNNPKLKDLYVRPSTTQKRTPGTLEAHTNGFLYTSLRGEKVEILFNNIKHAIFQPCDHEIIILVHFHLKHAIMYGKKKIIDIQFYTEVGEVITDLGKHTKGGDRDDLIAEQSEREMRKKLNMAFKSFIEKVEGLTNHHIQFEKPFRDLGFNGTPNRSMALLQPTSSCLINVTEQPPFVLTLEQIELVHFERVSFHLKNFDMVFIFKDYNKKVVMITSIPMNQLDQIKEWLNSCDIKYTEGLQSFNWPKIMKTIIDDPEGFFDQGGWNFLESESDEEEKEVDDDISDEEDDPYDPSESDDESEAESESELSESDESESESESGSASGSDAESGKSWSELEEEARRHDLEIESDHSDRDTKKRKKPMPSSKVTSSAKKPRK